MHGQVIWLSRLFSEAQMMTTCSWNPPLPATINGQGFILVAKPLMYKALSALEIHLQIFSLPFLQARLMHLLLIAMLTPYRFSQNRLIVLDMGGLSDITGILMGHLLGLNWNIHPQI